MSLAVLITRRLALGVLIPLFVSVLVFAGTEVLPGDVAQAILGQGATAEIIANVVALNLDFLISAIYVSHDLAVVAQIADQVLVLRNGAMVELDTAGDIITRPVEAYTRQLIGAAHVMPATVSPGRAPPDPDGTGAPAPLLRVSGVTAGYGRSGEHIALRDVSLEAFASRTLGIIGESGSGKTTLGRVIAGLMPARSGEVSFQGRKLGGSVGERDREQLRAIQFAFQMADVALNPRHRVEKILGRPLSFYFGLGGEGAQRRVRELLALVELPASYASRYPRQLSGGERQRVNLARALAAEPKLIVCDEITSALDTVVAQAILDLLRDLQERLEVGYLFISHDISTVARVADTIAVMQNGEVVEHGSTEDVLAPPHHPYSAGRVRGKRGIVFGDPDVKDGERGAVVDLFERTMAEDKVQLANLQRGLSARSYRPGPLGPADVEGTVWDFYQYMARRLG